MPLVHYVLYILGSARSESSMEVMEFLRGRGNFLPSFWREKYETMLKCPAGE